MDSPTTFDASIRLSDFYFKPKDVEQTFDQLVNSLAFQAELETDNNYDPEIRDFWLRFGRPVGDDLRAIDIQRNRDHGLRSFNDYRVWSGKPKAVRWEDYLDTVFQGAVDRWKACYASVDDVDLTVGISNEFHEPGTLGGPLLNRVMLEQFYRTRVADRFFFENGGDKNTRFTLGEIARFSLHIAQNIHYIYIFDLDQVKQIRRSSMATLLCNNNKLTQIQARGFELVSDKYIYITI